MLNTSPLPLFSPVSCIWCTKICELTFIRHSSFPPSIVSKAYGNSSWCISVISRNFTVVTHTVDSGLQRKIYSTKINLNLWCSTNSMTMIVHNPNYWQLIWGWLHNANPLESKNKFSSMLQIMSHWTVEFVFMCWLSTIIVIKNLTDFIDFQRLSIVFNNQFTGHS